MMPPEALEGFLQTRDVTAIACYSHDGIHIIIGETPDAARVALAEYCLQNWTISDDNIPKAMDVGAVIERYFEINETEWIESICCVPISLNDALGNFRKAFETTVAWCEEQK